MNYTVFDIFSGCGGMSWGLHKAGFNIIGALDEWDSALETFKFNHPEALIFNDDIRKIHPVSVMEKLGIKRGELACLIGGPPCQGFSKNVPSSYRFLEDPRNQLFNNYIEYVEAFYPSVVVMENVAEIYNAFDGSIRKEIIKRLESIGYQVSVEVLFAADYGIPQRRRRCFFLATRTGATPKFPEPTFTKTKTSSLFDSRKSYISAWAAISDLPSLQNGEGHEPMEYPQEIHNDYQRFMRGTNPMIYDHVTRELKGVQLERVKSLKAGEGLKDLPAAIRPKSGYSGAYGRLDFEMIAPTITRWVFHPGSGRFCHPKDERLITIREAARLQSFTDDFRFIGTYIEKSHQIGNAVPPLFMYALANEIKRCLNYKLEMSISIM